MKNNIFMILIGAMVGSVITALYLNAKHIQDIEEAKDVLMEDVNSVFTKRGEVGYSRFSPKPDPIEKVLVMNRDRYRKVVKSYNSGVDLGPGPDCTAEVTPGMDMTDMDPYLISYEEYHEDEENDKVLWYYYMEDAVLTDEDDEAINDISGTIGDDSLLCFDTVGVDVFYVRNNREEIDYQVVRRDASYSETMFPDED